MLGVGGDGGAEFDEEFVFDPVEIVLGGEDADFPFFEFGGDVAFLVGEGLFADVVYGDLVGFEAGDADIVAEGFIEADFEIGDARSIAFDDFEIGNPLMIFGG